MVKQEDGDRITKVRKILKDEKTRVVTDSSGKTKGGVAIVEGSALHNKYSKELADLEAKVAREKESMSAGDRADTAAAEVMADLRQAGEEQAAGLHKKLGEGRGRKMKEDEGR